MLKGFSLCPQFVTSPQWRAQYDIDLLFRREEVLRARDAAARIGYEPLDGFDRVPLDHMPTMIRKTGWEWRGDYFDPEIPLALELHFRLWDERTEGFGVDTSAFWDRRERRELCGLEFAALHRADAVGYACLHLLRHLLRGDLRPSHVYELASFLQRAAEDDDLWGQWLELHGRDLRRAEAIAFGLARQWFACEIAPAAAEEIAALPERVADWLRVYGDAPLRAQFQPNKDELWLHLSLLDSRSTKLAVMRRRLIPARLPGPVDAVHVPENEITWRRRLRRQWRYTSYLGERTRHHAQTLWPTLKSGLAWSAHTAGLEASFWHFFVAASLFNAGLFVFFLLYNLYLLQIGFSEKFIGALSSSMIAGSVAGSLGAAVALSRWGLRRTMRVCLIALGAASAARAIVTAEPALIGLAFLCGCGTATWAVALSPTVASLTTERSRPRAFSLVCASGIGLGVAAGVIGGRLPGWLAPIAGSQVGSYRAALVLASLTVVLGIWPLSKFGDATVPREPAAIGRPSRTLIRFLIAIAVWHLATGAFNPFFNTFFAHLKIPVSRIGLLFSVSQMAQTAAVLLAPLALRRLGLLRGVASMQLATAVTMGFLVFTSSAAGAAFLYAAYMSAQFMSEPGMFSYLMDSTPPEGRNTASSLNFVVAFTAQAIAAAVAGVAIVRVGYPAVIGVAAILCAVSALLFRFLVSPVSRGSRATP